MRKPRNLLHDRVPPSPCPTCNKMMDGATCVTDRGAQAKPGMASMCFYCGTLCIFTRTMRLRLMKSGEFDEWSLEHPGLFERMEFLRQQVMRKQSP